MNANLIADWYSCWDEDDAGHLYDDGLVIRAKLSPAQEAQLLELMGQRIVEIGRSQDRQMVAIVCRMDDWESSMDLFAAFAGRLGFADHRLDDHHRIEHIEELAQDYIARNGLLRKNDSGMQLKEGQTRLVKQMRNWKWN